MSESILNKTLVLSLNKSWQPIGALSVRNAIVFLASQHNGEKPGFALDLTTAIDENGQQTLVGAVPVAWDEWVKLPVRDEDLSINTSSGPIRVPLVVICAKFNRVPTSMN